MTADELALLNAIADAPADDTPRLVYADWLDDHDRPIRAEFIRLQCRIAQVETQPRVVVNAQVGLWIRQQELLDNHLPELLGPLAGVEPDVPVQFRRGFVEEIRLYLHHFLKHAATIATAKPLPNVIRVWEVGADPCGFGACPHLGIVTHISANFDVDSSLEFMPRNIPDWHDTVRRLTRLVELDLENCVFVNHLLESGIHLGLPAITYLDLSHTELSQENVIAILDSPLPQHLKRLVLGGNPLTDHAAFELADRWPRESPLENLNLRFCHFTPAGQQALLARFGGKVDLF